MASLSLTRTTSDLQAFYLRITKNTHSGLSALMAVSRKLLRLIYALCRDNTTYQTHTSASVPAAG